MRAALLVGLLMGLLVASTFAQEVVVLDNASFDDAIAKHDLVLVEFFAPWCGHCKSLAPKFAAAAEALHAQGITNAILASVDCTVETELAQRFGIEGYPTLIAFKKEAKISYNGARETDAIIGFIKKKAAPAVQAVTKASDIDAFASAGAIVLFGGSSDDLAVFSAAADSDEIYNYYHVSDAAVIEATGAASPSLKLFRTFSTTPAVSTSFPLTAASLAEFVEANGFPAVSEINQDSYQRLSKRPYPLIILVVDTENTELKEQWLATLNTLAAEFPTLSLTYGPSSQLLNAVKQFGGTGDFLPSFIGFIVPGMSNVDTTLPARFAWPEDIALTEESARTWLQSVVDGKPSINKKSEPIPEDNSGPVKVVVARTFDEIVLQSGKSVLVEFYAPWCGHCKSLAPIYEELGKKFAGNDKVAVAKIDATENYVDPAYNIQGFPTLILFKPDGSRVAYESDRTLEAFEAFLLQHTGEAGAAGSEHDEL